MIKSNLFVFFLLKLIFSQFLPIVWTILRTVHISPRWGLDLGGPDVSIDIPPRWGCRLIHLSLFFLSCVCVRHSQKNQNLTEIVQTL